MPDEHEGPYLEWQYGDKPSSSTGGGGSSPRAMTESLYANVSPSHPTWIIHGACMAAALEIAKREADPRVKLDGDTPRVVLDRHFSRFKGEVKAFVATGSASVIELADAMNRDPAVIAVKADRGFNVAGAGVHGSDYNLYGVVLCVKGDPQAAGARDPVKLEQNCLHPDLQYGDEQLIGKPPRPIEVWVL